MDLMPSYFGKIEFNEPETVDIPSLRNRRRKIALRMSHGKWLPPERLGCFFPEDFSVPIDCSWTTNGMRRFCVGGSFDELIDLAIVGGLAVIQGIHGSNREVNNSYRFMKHVFDHIRGRAHRSERGMQAHLTREFGCSRDLYIRLLGRDTPDQRDVLPDTIGLTSQGEGQRWSVEELTRRGRKVAFSAGYPNPTNGHAIHFGLLEAARLNPLDLPLEEVPRLVRFALFDIDSSENEPDPKLLDCVSLRLRRAIHQNLDRESDLFDRWFSGPNNSLVKQIAQQKKSPGGELDRQDVRQALLYLGWQAYEYVGQCLNVLMRTIKNSISERLSDEERQLFEHMHEIQPYYGNMPLALLCERMGFLKHAILAIWNEPQNKKHVRVLHRLLQIYAEMAVVRRQADRQSKRRGEAGAIPVKYDDSLHSPAEPSERPFQKAAAHIRELNGIECDKGCSQWEIKLQDESEDRVTFLFRCECGLVTKKVPMTKSDFEKVARE